MIKKTVEQALNKQINAELYSAYAYLSMSAYFSQKGLEGMASWMKNQAQEEVGHGMKMYDYLIERGGTVILDKINKPATSWGSPLHVFETSYKHEVAVTKMIHNLVDLATKEKDHALHTFMQWFVDEQVEEEASADAIVQKLKMIKNDSAALFLLDKGLSERKGD